MSCVVVWLVSCHTATAGGASVPPPPAVADQLQWESAEETASHLRPACAYITPPPPSSTSPVNTYGFEAYLLKTQGLLRPEGPHPPTTNNQIWMPNRF